MVKQQLLQCYMLSSYNYISNRILADKSLKAREFEKSLKLSIISSQIVQIQKSHSRSGLISTHQYCSLQTSLKVKRAPILLSGSKELPQAFQGSSELTGAYLELINSFFLVFYLMIISTAVEYCRVLTIDLTTYI